MNLYFSSATVPEISGLPASEQKALFNRLPTRVRQLNAQVIDCYEPRFKNVYYKRESCCGWAGLLSLRAAKTRSWISESREMPLTDWAA